MCHYKILIFLYYLHKQTVCTIAPINAVLPAEIRGRMGCGGITSAGMCGLCGLLSMWTDSSNSARAMLPFLNAFNPRFLCREKGLINSKRAWSIPFIIPGGATVESTEGDSSGAAAPCGKHIYLLINSPLSPLKSPLC